MRTFMTNTIYTKCRDDQVGVDEFDGTCSMPERYGKYIQNLNRELEGNRPLDSSQRQAYVKILIGRLV
jgi:hypothetical protein